MYNFIDEIVSIWWKRLEITDDDWKTMYTWYEIVNTLKWLGTYEHDFNFLFVSNDFIKSLLGHKVLTKDWYDTVVSSVSVNKDEPSFITDEYHNLLFFKNENKRLMWFDTKKIFIIM